MTNWSFHKIQNQANGFQYLWAMANDLNDLEATPMYLGNLQFNVESQFI